MSRSPAVLLHQHRETAGTRYVLRPGITIIGQAAADIQLPPPADGVVAERHAAIIERPNGYLVRDLDSSQGTWVNGERLAGDWLLRSGDQIRLGSSGPLLEFRLEQNLPPQRHFPTNRARGISLGVVLLLTALAFWFYREQPSGAIVDRLLKTLDSAAAEVTALAEREGVLRSALDSTRRELESIREVVAGLQMNRGVPDSLGMAIDRIQTNSRQLVAAARLDLTTITSEAAPAAALLLVDRGRERMVYGTAFSILSRGDTTWAVTSKHLIVREGSDSARRLGLVWNESRQNFEAELVALHPDRDLALLRAVIKGGAPALSLDQPASITIGTIAGTISFPTEIPVEVALDQAGSGLRATVFPAAITELSDTTMELIGYGAPGMSGSPVVDHTGRLLGVLFGGKSDPTARRILVVPRSGVLELLRIARLDVE